MEKDSYYTKGDATIWSMIKHAICLAFIELPFVIHHTSHRLTQFKLKGANGGIRSCQ